MYPLAEDMSKNLGQMLENIFAPMYPLVEDMSNFWANGCSTLRKAEDLMPRDIMSSEPRHWMVFGQLVMPVQCCAEAPAAVPQHSTAQA